MRYKLMNEYTVDWPFWGGRDGAGLCADDDPSLPRELSTAIRAWATQFQTHFLYERGWSDPTIAAAHAREGERLYHAVKHALPYDDVTFDYWERDRSEVR